MDILNSKNVETWPFWRAVWSAAIIFISFP